MKSKVMFACAVIALAACNKVKDSNPQAANVPEKVVQIVKEKHENASDIVFSEIVPDKIWEVKLATPQKKIEAAVNNTNIISSYRLAGNEVPDSLVALLQSFAVTGGTFSNFREEEYTWIREGNYGKGLDADYNWHGETYLFRWNATVISGKATYELKMVPGVSRIVSSSSQDLPGAISQYISNKGLTVNKLEVYKNAQGQNTYRVYVNNNSFAGILLFNSQNQIIDGPGQSVPLDKSALPGSIQSYLANSPEYNNFLFEGWYAGVSMGGITKKTYDGITRYNIVLVKNVPGQFAGTQSWSIILDEQGNVIWRDYMALAE